ncbi:MAG: hypothetical protein FWD38_03115 [Oscillospiraceae bacterium]|nr:hypothetical protein [Oscillospiraceae bacterium]
MDFDELDYDKITELLNKRDEEEKRERERKKKDWKSITASVMCLIAFCVMAAVWVVLEMAAPEREMRFITTFFNVHFGAESVIRATWNYPLVYTAYVLQLISLGLCMISSTLNIMYIKPKYKNYKISIFIISGITLIAFIFFIIQFAPVLF